MMAVSVARTRLIYYYHVYLPVTGNNHLLKKYAVMIHSDDPELLELIDAWFDDRILVGDTMFVIECNGKLVLIDSEDAQAWVFDSLQELAGWILDNDDDAEDPDIKRLRRAFRDGRLFFYLVPWEKAGSAGLPYISP